MWKSVLAGALAAILVLAIAGAGFYVYQRGVGGASDEDKQSRVILIFESPAEDGARVAALIALVADGRMQDISPDTTVTIPGTSYNLLRDALVFGGGVSVVRAIGERYGGPATAYVSVPESVWRSAVDTTRGVQVNIPTDLTVFDGEELTTIRSGEQTMTGAGVAALLRGLPYVSEVEGVALRRQLEQRLGAALVTNTSPTDSLQSDLSPRTLEAWLATYLSRAVISQVK